MFEGGKAGKLVDGTEGEAVKNWRTWGLPVFAITDKEDHSVVSMWMFSLLIIVLVFFVSGLAVHVIDRLIFK